MAVHLSMSLKGTVTGVRYMDEVLEPYVCLFRGACVPEFILMDDNARPHRSSGIQATVVDEFLEGGYSLYGLANQVSRPQPYRACLGSCEEGNCNPLPLLRTIQEMKIALLNEWDQLPHTRTDKLPYFKHDIML
ncbi:transposable element Tcb2 transposase [Trichonephila clavipes]|nr:transposable element Tcb2 transposase [Trichonephila clavipes]